MNIIILTNLLAYRGIVRAFEMARTLVDTIRGNTHLFILKIGLRERNLVSKGSLRNTFKQPNYFGFFIKRHHVSNLFKPIKILGLKQGY